MRRLLMSKITIIKNFYQQKKTSLEIALQNYFASIDKNYFIPAIRKISSKEINLIIFPRQSKKNISFCPICLDNIYRNQYLRVIPIYLYDRYFFLQPSPKQYVKYHLVIIDLFHVPQAVNPKTIDYFAAFLKHFPKMFIATNCTLKKGGASILNHLHYQAGLDNLPVFNCDATQINGNLYRLEYLTPLYFIKDDDIENIKKTFLQIWQQNNSIDNSFNLIMRKINNTFWLYLALRNENATNNYEDFKKGIGVFEIAGNFIIEESHYKIDECFTLAKEILKTQTIALKEYVE